MCEVLEIFVRKEESKELVPKYKKLVKEGRSR